ncbi:histidine phosphatase family protein [Patescibacteria group bacterium]|nr:histidine phosphatase family protein [Patescibacteria group bacterium]MBU1349657.1 histidine phosphatase family protein [Patescibacteria group bacterium]MBU2416773.1 histidine phosphatase family protein [Patescibacteria group bacterium]MBU2456985.1 histidine phosphatase family protein [Patescibacteria group bacterium]
MEKIEGQFESREKYGENIEMIIDLIRHAEKSDLEGGLTEKGKEEAKKYGEKIRTEFPESAGVKVYHSGVKRAEETGKLLKGESKFIERQREPLTLIGKLSKEQGEKLIALVNKQTCDETEAIQALIDTGDKKLDKETASSKELSRGIAEQILTLVKMTGKFKENSKVNVALISHSGVIEHFLVDILKKPRENFLKEIKGAVDFLEGAHITVQRQDKETVKILFQFRDYEFEINEQDLEKIINE